MNLKRTKKTPQDTIGFCNGQHINMIRKQAYSFHQTTGISYSELYAEASVLYYESMKKWDKKKSSLFTWSYLRIRNGLIDFCRNEQKYLYVDIPENFELGYLDRNFDKKENHLLTLFSGKCKEIVDILLTDEAIDIQLPPKKVRGQIVEELKRRGWKQADIWKNISEVKSIINLEIL